MQWEASGDVHAAPRAVSSQKVALTVIRVPKCVVRFAIVFATGGEFCVEIVSVPATLFTKPSLTMSCATDVPDRSTANVGITAVGSERAAVLPAGWPTSAHRRLVTEKSLLSIRFFALSSLAKRAGLNGEEQNLSGASLPSLIAALSTRVKYLAEQRRDQYFARLHKSRETNATEFIRLTSSARPFILIEANFSRPAILDYQT